MSLPADRNCTTVHHLFPPVPTHTQPPWFEPYDDNYTCLSREEGTVSLGTLTSCNLTLKLSAGEGGVQDAWVRRQLVTRADIWWFCGGKTLRPTLTVDWINYLYYNQQRFINYTRDGIKGLSIQLDRTSLMAWQNRLALDMLLAEKGGVCKMFGDMCCTFIPNNTAPDGSVTRALAGLTSLSEEFTENSGIGDHPYFSWMESMFRRWSGLIKSVLVTIIIITTIMTALCCCCVPFLRDLVQRLIDVAMNKMLLYTRVPDGEDKGDATSYLSDYSDDEITPVKCAS